MNNNKKEQFFSRVRDSILVMFIVVLKRKTDYFFYVLLSVPFIYIYTCSSNCVRSVDDQKMYHVRKQYNCRIRTNNKQNPTKLDEVVFKQNFHDFILIIRTTDCCPPIGLTYTQQSLKILN